MGFYFELILPLTKPGSGSCWCLGARGFTKRPSRPGSTDATYLAVIKECSDNVSNNCQL